VKFRQLKEGDEHTPNAIDRGWITLQNHMETDNNRYLYERVEGHQDPWVTLEMYEWELLHLRRVTVPRDRDWFARSQSIFQAFWKDVADAREGKWTPLPVKARKAKGVESPAATCAIVDDDLDEGSPLSTLAAKVAVVTVLRDVPEPISYTD
jgi:hypothetical protein